MQGSYSMMKNARARKSLSAVELQKKVEKALKDAEKEFKSIDKNDHELQDAFGQEVLGAISLDIGELLQRAKAWGDADHSWAVAAKERVNKISAPMDKRYAERYDRVEEDPYAR